MPHPCHTFENSTGPFLQNLGFRLDPKRVTGTYQTVGIQYTNDRGFNLFFSFDPHDGRYASINCGRRWSHSNGSGHLSGLYCDLAKRFGFSLPQSYSLAGPEKTTESLALIDENLAESLPAVLAQMTIEDIEAIERKRYGAARFMQFALRRTPNTSVQVSELEFED